MQNRSLMSTLDHAFERFVGGFLELYTHSFTFMIAVLIVIIYLFNTDFRNQDIRESLGDIMTCFSFLIFFIIQKSVSRYSLAIQIKLNELVASHEHARNEIVNIEQKSTKELQELAELYKEQDLQDEENHQREKDIINNNKPGTGRNKTKA